MIKERANGLYGPTAFLIANVIIGLPFLCTILISLSNLSHYLASICGSNVLAHQPPIRRSPILQLSRYSLPCFISCRIPRRSRLLFALLSMRRDRFISRH